MFICYIVLGLKQKKLGYWYYSNLKSSKYVIKHSTKKKSRSALKGDYQYLV